METGTDFPAVCHEFTDSLTEVFAENAVGSQIGENTNGFLKWYPRIGRMELIQIDALEL
jgi:hypothetical protein